MDLDYWPHPITTEGRLIVEAADGMTLEDALLHVLPPSEYAVAIVDGTAVARPAWRRVILREGMTVQVRVTVHGGDGSNIFAAILSIAVLIAAPYLAPALLGFAGITASAGILAATTAVVGLAGVLAVNTLFPPRTPSLRGRANIGQAQKLYTLSAGQNIARPYEPLALLLGRHRMFPDLVALPYTEYDDQGDQYLNQIFDFGLGENMNISNLRIEETDLATYEDVETQQQVDTITLVHGNVNTYQGGDLEYNVPIERTTSNNTNRVAFDVAGQHFTVNEETGDIIGQGINIRLEYRLTGTANYTQQNIGISSPSGGDARTPTRESYGFDVPAGQYDLRATLLTQHDESDSLVTFMAALPAFRAYQPNMADFSARNSLAIRAKATGQLYGTIGRLSADVFQRIPVFDSGLWVTQQTSNPAWIYLKYLRGWFRGNVLIAGMGLADERINLEEIFAFAAFCEAQSLSCNLILDDGRDHAAAITRILQCGWGSESRASGRWGVVWENAGSPLQAIFSPANIIAGTLSVNYENEALADEIIGTYIDEQSDFEENTLRRTVPGVVGTPKRSVVLPLEGITVGEQAAKEINRTAAAQFFHSRTVSFEAEADAAYVARGTVVGLSHDLAGGTEGGRLLSIDVTRSIVELSQPVGAAGVLWVWCLDGTVHSTAYSAGAYPADTVLLTDVLPVPPMGIADDPLAYKCMAFSSVADVNKFRIVGIERAPRDRYRLVLRDEVDAYYAARTADLDAPLIPRRDLPDDFPTDPDLVGRDGDDGEDAQGVEYIFTRTALPNLPGGMRPSNVWGFDEPGTSAGQVWTDGADNLTADLPLLWRCARRVIGQPDVGAAVFANWSDPVIVGRYGPQGVAGIPGGDGQEGPPGQPGLDGVPGIAGEDGLDGVEGADGDDGQGVEYIFALTATEVLTVSRRPDNAWGFDDPGTRGGLEWHDGAPDLTEALPYLWRSARAVPGMPVMGDAVAENWSEPTIVAELGFSKEYIFAATAGSTLPVSQRPLNSWGFDDPGTRNGLQWHDGAIDLTTVTPYLWQSERAVNGAPAVGATVHASWTVPVVVGELGAGKEYIFAVTEDADVPTDMLPLNSWGYDNPQARNGLQWNDGAPAVNATTPYLQRCERDTYGAPVFDAEIADNWSAPAVVSHYGLSAIEDPDFVVERVWPAQWFIEITEVQENALIGLGNTLNTEFTDLANNAGEGDNVQGDFVTFVRSDPVTGTYASAWTWDETGATDVWRRAARFIAAENIAAINLTALGIVATDALFDEITVNLAHVTGVLDAAHISSDVRNVDVLYTSMSGVPVNSENQIYEFPLNRDVRDYEYVHMGAEVLNGALRVAAASTQFIPRRMASGTGSARAGTHRFAAGVGAGNNDFFRCWIWRSADGRTVWAQPDSDDTFGVVYSLVGVNNPGSTQDLPDPPDPPDPPVPPGLVMTEQTIYRLSVNQPATPVSATLAVPVLWSTTQPSPTVTQGVWESSRTISTLNGFFLSATLFSTPTEIAEPIGVALAITSPGLVETTVGTFHTQTFPAATGGAPPYTYDLLSFHSGEGLSLNASTRRFSGTPTVERATDQVTYRVTDNDGATDTVSFELRIAAAPVALAITSPGLVEATVGTFHTQTFPAATGGAPPYTYDLLSFHSGEGLSLNASTRRFSGTPTQARATDQVTYRVTDNDGATDTVSFELRIAAAPVTDLMPTIPSLPASYNVTVGVFASFTLPAASGGDPPLTYSVTSLGNGFTFNASTRTISGTAINSGDDGFRYWVTDVDGDQDSTLGTVSSSQPDLMPTIPSLPAQYEVTVGVFASFTLPAASSGDPPLTYSVTGLSNGFSFNPATRTISGTAINNGGDNWTYRVTDADGDSDSTIGRIFASNPDLMPSLPSLPAQYEVTVGVFTSFTLPAASSGDPPLTYSVTGLSNGFSFSSATRTISGTAINNGGDNWTYRVSDADGDTDSTTGRIFASNP